jgi:hypothetical protein
MLDGTMNPDEAPPEQAVDEPSPKAARGQSTIQFPYADLEAAVGVARIMRDRGGNSQFTKDQLAAALGHAVKSGAFVAKLHAARMFGLIETVAGKSRVTQLGFNAIDSDSDRAKSARAEAFLRVALYQRTYEEYRGKTLPARPHGLDRGFIDFGVTSTRAHNARWAFERSARYAGYFDHGEERLVAPLIVAAAEGERADEPPTSSPAQNPQGPQQTQRFAPSSDRHHLIKGLFEELPEPQAKWGAAERVRWLRLAASMFDVLYTTEDGKAFVVEVKTTRDNTDG